MHVAVLLPAHTCTRASAPSFLARTLTRTTRVAAAAACRERRKQKYSNLQETVDELSTRLCQLNTLEAANSELQQRNGQLEVVVKEQNAQLQVQKDTITRQAQQLQTQVGLVGTTDKFCIGSLLAAPAVPCLRQCLVGC